MRLGFSAPFDPNNEPESFFESFPSRPAVFALFPSESAVTTPPYLRSCASAAAYGGKLLTSAISMRSIRDTGDCMGDANAEALHATNRVCASLFLRVS